jgi:hypothetical protein
MRSNYFEASDETQMVPDPANAAKRYKYPSNKCKIFMSAKFQLKSRWNFSSRRSIGRDVVKP